MIALLDGYIDGIHRAAPATTGRFGPFGSIGSLINVVICGVGGGAGTIAAILGENVPLFLPLIFVILEVVFVRVAMRARRGDFEEG